MNDMRRFSLVLPAVLLLLLLAPPALWATDYEVLGRKGIISGKEITDKRFASVIQNDDGIMYFDDIANALLWRAGQCAATLLACDAATWAFDFYTKELVHMSAAFYVISTTVNTPAGSGAVALSTEEAARRFIAEYEAPGALVLDFDQMQERFE